jgi:hypothetical protein
MPPVSIRCEYGRLRVICGGAVLLDDQKAFIRGDHILDSWVLVALHCGVIGRNYSLANGFDSFVDLWDCFVRRSRVAKP